MSKVGTRTPRWDKNGNKVETKWEQSGNKNTKVGQEWEQIGNKEPQSETLLLVVMGPFLGLEPQLSGIVVVWPWDLAAAGEPALPVVPGKVVEELASSGAFWYGLPPLDSQYWPHTSSVAGRNLVNVLVVLMVVLELHGLLAFLL